MGSNRSSQVPLVLYMVTISAALFFIQDQIFHDRRNAEFYLMQDLAFLPLQALLVTLVLNAILSRRDKEERLYRLNMVIGSFFFDIGNPLLKLFILFDRHSSYLSPRLQMTAEWTSKELTQAMRETWEHTYDMDCLAWNMGKLKGFLTGKRESLVRLLENPSLAEHESFTELLWAANHLADELAYRNDVDNLAAPDAAHLADDMRRAYFLLLSTWFAYLIHIQRDYPFLFSLVVRTNPFNAGAKAEITEAPTAPPLK